MRALQHDQYGYTCHYYTCYCYGYPSRTLSFPDSHRQPFAFDCFSMVFDRN